ncbi:GNAT family N-acetyltransferase [Aquimarina sp. 2304DJ70-9]|uniref:GNAT family N-acetyltransferase n=1 Tax=Aquimarina penaris TaxID=3231044 RepID=UPI003462AACB
MEFNIRKHKPGDIGWIISMHGEIYIEEFNFDPNFEIHIANKFVHFFRKEKSSFDTVFICETDEERVGSIAISNISDTKAFINFVLISPKYRGNGISRTLLDVVIQHCRNHHYKSIELETYDLLKSARNLYDQYGFTIKTVHKNVELFGQTMDQEFWEMRL